MPARCRRRRGRSSPGSVGPGCPPASRCRNASAPAQRALFAKENRFVGRIAIIAAIGGFLFGYDTGIIRVANVYAAKSLHFGPLGEPWTVGALLLGAISGAALTGRTAEERAAA